MPDRVFQDAYAAVRRRYSEDAWYALSPRQITEAIYQEIRDIDAARARDTASQIVAVGDDETDAAVPASSERKINGHRFPSRARPLPN